MTRETWQHDLRTVDEIVMCSGEAMRDDPRETLLWRCVYGLAVAVYHILLDKIKEDRA